MRFRGHVLAGVVLTQTFASETFDSGVLPPLHSPRATEGRTYPPLTDKPDTD
jgi:hypothetical protein